MAEGGGIQAVRHLLRDEVPRTRLVEALDRRWSTALTFVEAPGGFGKSTALLQAVRHNAADPIGIDVMVACRRFHSDATVLAPAILALLDGPTAALPSDPVALADLIQATIATLASTTLCLILDDVHHLRADDSSSTMLRALVDGMPANMRLVLAGRSMPKLPRARLLAADQFSRFGPNDLAFSADEVATLAGHHQVDPSTLRSAEGWPALTRLAITVGSVAPVDYLVEEVAAGLSEDEARAVAAVVIGTGHPVEWLGSLCGAPDLCQVIDRVPLLSITDEGSAVGHDLWSGALDNLVDAGTRTAFAGAVARKAATDEAFDEAIDLATQHQAWGPALEAVLGLAMGGESFPSHRRLLALRRRFPDRFDDQPELLLLDAMIERISNAPGGGAARADRALDAFRDRGDAPAIAAAAFEVGYGAWLRGDLARVLEMYSLGQALLSEGHRFLVPLMSVVEAVTADLKGDAHTAATLLESVDLSQFPAPLVIYILRELMSKLQLIGETNRAVHHAQKLRAYTTDPRVDFAIALAHWMDGDPSIVVETWDQLRHRQIENNQTDFLTWVYSAVIDASLGITVGSAEMPEFATGRSREQAFRAIGRAATSVAAGDERCAEEEFETLSHEVGFDDALCIGELRRQLTIGYVLSAEVRRVIDSQPLGPAHARRREITRMLCAVRAGRPVRWSDLGSAEELLSAFPLRWTAELLAAAHHAAIADAPVLADRIDRYTDGRLQYELTLVPGRTARFGDAAGSLLEALRGARREVRIDVFGPMTIVIRSKADGPSVRRVSRQRVRQLLGMLVLHERVRIDEVLGALWPDMPAQQARNNLAVTLKLAREMLDHDPSCEPASPSVSSPIDRDDTFLRLRAGSVESDLWDARHLIGIASTRRKCGDVAGSMQALAGAVELWSGPLLDDLVDVHPFGARCVALSRELSDAAAALSEWYLSQGDIQRALLVGRRLLSTDPYDERGHAVVISALIEAKDRAELISAARACREALTELAVEPGRSLAMILRRADAVHLEARL